MAKSRTQLMLQIEPFVLRSAVQAYLESDPRFSTFVFTERAGRNNGEAVDPAADRVIGLELKEPTHSFELSVDGLRRDFPYQGMNHLADQIAAVCIPSQRV
jgi:hypothetical protein